MIYCIADTVFDIVIEDGEPQSSSHGGCMYNVAIDLGRLHADVAVYGFAGCDRIGEMAKDFLSWNHVDDSGFLLVPGLKTSLALAFLDEQKKPSWTFYKYRPQSYSFFPFPAPVAGDILAFGSSLVLQDDFFDRFLKMLQKTGDEVLKYYDPNLRGMDAKKRSRVEQLMQAADVIKASEEELELLFENNTPDLESRVRPEQLLMITAGEEPLKIRWKGQWYSYEVPETHVISTAGAGDAYSAGLLSAIPKQTCDINRFTQAQIESIVKSGLAAAAQACRSKNSHI